MKNAFTIAVTLCLFPLFGCKKDKEESLNISCIEEKIETFKQDPSAAAIVKIEKPGDTLYWFEDIYGDGIEEVLNESCEVVCITDCECTGNFVFCDETHFNHPMEIIWEK
jgi:hypothetical protein